MKRWEMPTIDELNVSETQHGGTPSMDFDSEFYDEQGALHVTFRGDDDGTHAIS